MMSSDSKAAQHSAKPRRCVLLATAAIGIPILVLVLLEVGLRICDVGYSPDLLMPCTVHGSAASCYNLFFAATYFPAGMVQTPRLYAIPAQKPPRTFRIFVLGESAAMGDPDPAYGFSRYLEVMLRERYPTIKFEVYNTGSVAINSHVVLPIAEQLRNQRPDLFIIYSGNNEVVGPYGPGTVLTSTGLSIPFIRASIFYHTTRIGQLVTKLGTHKQEWRGMEMFLDQQVRADSPLMKPVYNNFERNLRDTIAAGRASGAHVIVATVATNLKDCAPFASEHKEGLGQDAQRSWDSLFQQGKDKEQAGAFEDAIGFYSSAGKIDSDHAELAFRMARSLWSLGNYKSAAEYYRRARDLDTLRFRADTHINEINRSVASSSSVDLVDADAILTGASPDGIVGGDLVYEHVHLTPEANYLVARAMFEKVAAQLAARGEVALQSGVPTESDCERLLALTRYDRARIANEMMSRMQKAPFTTQLNHSEQVFRLMGKAQLSDETPNDTATQYQWAIMRQPDDRMLRLRYGMFLVPYNRAAAAEQLAMAQPWDGFPVFLPDGTQVR